MNEELRDCDEELTDGEEVLRCGYFKCNKLSIGSDKSHKSDSIAFNNP
jgi:hypothetical protein